MKNKGFTLVELLAVIVILAVIALITIPAVMKMIDNATVNSYRRSIDLYGKAVSAAIIEYQSDMLEKNRAINITFDNIESYIEYEGNEVDCKIKQIYSDRTVFLSECSVNEELVYANKNIGYGDDNYYYYANSLRKIKLIKYIEAVEEALQDKNISGTCNISEDKITCSGENIGVRSKLENAIEGTLTIENDKVKKYNNLKFETEKKIIKQEAIPEIIDEENTSNDNNSTGNNNPPEVNNTICKSKSGTVSTELGTEYECEVKEGTKFNFYVLSKEGDKVNLIMDRNICEDGTTNYTSTNNYCRYDWHEYVTLDSGSPNGYKFGPETAMFVIHNATKRWSNIPDMIMDYDSNSDGYNTGGYAYRRIKTESKKTRILSDDNIVLTEIGSNNYPLKARLSTRQEVINAGCNNTQNSCPTWLSANLSDTNIRGYWLLPIADIEDRGSYVRMSAYNIGNSRNISSNDYSITTINGVRPVITVSTSDLS